MGKFVVVLGMPLRMVAKSHQPHPVSIYPVKCRTLNDTVSCPEHGMNKIIECDVSAYEENGRGIVLHGCKTQCGASVIASMPDTALVAVYVVMLLRRSFCKMGIAASPLCQNR